MLELEEPVTGFVTYLPATLKYYKSGYFIDYYALNPTTCKLERKSFRLNVLRKRSRTQQEFKVAANRMVCELNVKLSRGWSPFSPEYENSREMIPLKKAIASYIKDKSRDLRQSSLVSYTSVCNLLMEWLEQKKLGDISCHNFNQQLAQEVLDDFLTRPKFNNNTYNTYLKKYRACWSWMIEHGYSKINPFDKIKTRMKQEKIRGLIPADAREKVLEYVRASKSPNYEIVMHLIFTSLIRPAEIERLQVRDVDLVNKCIHVPADKAKTHKERYAPLSDTCILLLVDLLKGGSQPDWYLLNTKYQCGPEPAFHGKYKKDWEVIRRKCNLPADMQLYSLKDSGITELLQSGLDTLTVMNAADHHDLTTTTKYVAHRNTAMIEKVRRANVAL